jgi:two-component system response regulator AtoC
VGGTKSIKIDVRLLAATNRNLEEMTKEGKFREDLLYRLSVITIHLPQLKERREDIPALISHFFKKHCTNSGRNPAMSQEVMDALMNYDWPGNVRELENTIERLCQFSKGGIITLEDLHPKMAARNQSSPSSLFEDLPTMEELERRYLAFILEKTKSNKTQAAEILGIHRTTLSRMAERLSIDLREE